MVKWRQKNQLLKLWSINRFGKWLLFCIEFCNIENYRRTSVIWRKYYCNFESLNTTDLNVVLNSFLFRKKNRRFFGPRVRLRNRTCRTLRRCVGDTSADRGRPSRCISSQGRALSNPYENDGFASSRWRGSKTHTTRFWLDNSRSSLSQSRDGEQPWKFWVPLYAECCIYRPQSDTDSSEFRPGDDWCSRLSKTSRLHKTVSQE